MGKGGPCPVTEYKNEYMAHNQPRREAIRPDNDYKPSGIPMADVTTNKNDFIRHPVNKIAARQPEVYQAPSGAMDTMTSYSTEYQNKGGRPAVAIKRDNGARTTAQFEGNPTYKDDFRQWGIDRTKPIRKDDGYIPSSEKFAKDTTYIGDFKGYNQAPRSAIRPDQRAMVSNEPFADKTSNREDYIKFDLQPVYKKAKDPYVVNGIPMDNMTTNRRDYTAKAADMARSFKPDGQGYRSDAPFDDVTTNKNDYKKWGVQPMFAKREQTYMAPAGSMETSTNYSQDYTAKPNQRTVAVRPVERVKVDAKFEGDSTYGQDFRKWGGERRELARAPANYAPSGIPFDGQSTYKTQYMGNLGPAAHSFKPDSQAYRSSDPFDGLTSYRNEYIKKELPKCPTTLLDTDKSPYTYVTSDPQTGHKYYAPNQNANPVYSQ